MGLDALLQAGNAITSFFAGLNGVGATLVVIGLGMLLAIGAGIGLYMLVQLVKQIPRMTPWEFLKFVVISAVILIVIGVILP